MDCIEPGGPCDVNAICEELPGRNNFTCTCMPMFVGDGFVCERRKCLEEMKNKELDTDAFTIEVWWNFDNMQITFKAVSSNRKFWSRPLVGGKMRHCMGERKIHCKNHGGSGCLGKFSLLGYISYLSIPYSKYVVRDWHFLRLPGQCQTTVFIECSAVLSHWKA